MISDFRIKKGDTLPTVRATLSDEEGVFDLTNCTVKFVFRNSQSGVAVKKDASVVSATAGEVEYAWGAGDTDVPGVYLYEWEVTLTLSSKVISFPNGESRLFEIISDVG